MVKTEKLNIYQYVLENAYYSYDFTTDQKLLIYAFLEEGLKVRISYKEHEFDSIRSKKHLIFTFTGSNEQEQLFLQRFAKAGLYIISEVFLGHETAVVEEEEDDLLSGSLKAELTKMKEEEKQEEAYIYRVTFSQAYAFSTEQRITIGEIKDRLGSSLNVEGINKASLIFKTHLLASELSEFLVSNFDISFDLFVEAYEEES